MVYKAAETVYHNILLSCTNPIFFTLKKTRSRSSRRYGLQLAQEIKNGLDRRLPLVHHAVPVEQAQHVPKSRSFGERDEPVGHRTSQRFGEVHNNVPHHLHYWPQRVRLGRTLFNLVDVSEVGLLS